MPFHFAANKYVYFYSNWNNTNNYSVYTHRTHHRFRMRKSIKLFVWCNKCARNCVFEHYMKNMNYEFRMAWRYTHTLLSAFAFFSFFVVSHVYTIIIMFGLAHIINVGNTVRNVKCQCKTDFWLFVREWMYCVTTTLNYPVKQKRKTNEQYSCLCALICNLNMYYDS